VGAVPADHIIQRTVAGNAAGQEITTAEKQCRSAPLVYFLKAYERQRGAAGNGKDPLGAANVDHARPGSGRDRAHIGCFSCDTIRGFHGNSFLLLDLFQYSSSSHSQEHFITSCFLIRFVRCLDRRHAGMLDCGTTDWRQKNITC
jgi:hypothetical protein